ncbi:MAG: radical SAM protein [Deltaproteobacteria bacterium]|nr:radical SAM protein [Deltaproteobacteria bacterium]MBK8239327.1 radical SAM protein [Deltaproteobacteria bacterium]MBK8719595.1 radical SAM protein [Deltaproteobacteria bacterium]MBP7290885.1 radical SAM protein [Nannocystaceae bacterium]
MGLEDVRRKLPVVRALPPGRGRKHLVRAAASGEVPTCALAVWEFTLACDQKCLHCGPRAGLPRDDELSTEEALALVDELAEHGVGEVVLIGGEAYLRNDFLLVIRRIRERGMTATMTTGGYNLTAARARAMVEAGIQSVSVSIDGLRESHDWVRNRPESWDRAFAALGHLRAAGSRIACNTQINARSHTELPALLELLAAAGVRAWQLQITMPHGAAADHPELLLQPYQFPAVFELLDRIEDRCRELGVVIWPGNNLGYFGPFEHKLRRHQRGEGHFSGCFAGVTVMGIESNGAIKSCPSVGGPTNTGGSWREHGLQALWERAPEITYVRDRTTADLWGYCAECYYGPTCMSGCTAATEPLLGRPGNNPFCHHRALEMDRMGLRERVELVAAAPGLPFDNGLFRVVREHKDPELRERLGPVQIDEPRTSRLVDPLGPGRTLTAEERAALTDG